MKLIIDIPEEDYKNGTLINYFKVYSTELDKIIYDGTPLEEQPNRCDSCIHSEEQDGSNCYECVKGMADNFETQPCEDCISREEAKQFLYERIDRLNDDELYDIFSRIIDDMYNELPSVTPQRPKGKWIRELIRNEKK